MDFSTATFFVSLVIVSATTAIKEITVESGDDVTLQCQSPRDEAITLLTWSRPDLKKEDHVFFYRNKRPHKDNQHPSFHGRVQLRDAEMKNGDVSVILKNVTINDTGTYECHVLVNGKGLELINSINLKVEDSAGNTEEDEDGGNLGLTVGLSVTAVLLLLLLGIFIFIYIRKRREATMTSYQPPAETGSVPLQQ